ncbi:hypothetical protein AN216_14100 [Streptomyces oceani]|uniref:MarR family transcriptional regulator n=1 Tax=Streptomyces oceani TaxID=1075402 RepID=A0A1E7KFC9_9ACTN|nr:hypothetical protein AN216_14100 [Streptomyces oceani]
MNRVAEHYRDTDRMAWEHGFLIGWLMISDPVEQPASRLCEVLGVSREAVDHIDKLLVPPGVLERTELPDGEYSLAMNAEVWPQTVQQAMLALPSFHSVMRYGLEALADASEERRRRLVNMEQFFRYLGDEIPAVFDRYEPPATTVSP